MNVYKLVSLLEILIGSPMLCPSDENPVGCSSPESYAAQVSILLTEKRYFSYFIEMQMIYDFLTEPTIC